MVMFYVGSEFLPVSLGHELVPVLEVKWGNVNHIQWLQSQLFWEKEENCVILTRAACL